jgi:hypothetical protein
MAVEQAPDRGRGKDMSLFGQSVRYLGQCQVTLLINPLQDFGRVSLGSMTVPVAAHSVRSDTARALISLIPTHSRSNGNIELRSCRTPRKTVLNRFDDAKSKVIGKRCCHWCWPPYPSTKLESYSQHFGNPKTVPYEQKTL